MARFLLISCCLLAFQDPSPKATKSKSQEPTERETPAADPLEARARYVDLRAKAPKSAAAQLKLARWCEEHGLSAESTFHFSEVTRIDPSRTEAWKKLGFKKHDGRWMTDAQIAEVKEQKKWDKVWAPRLKKWHMDIHGSNGTKKRDQARAAVAEIKDPQVIPSLYREFAGGGPVDQMIAVQVLAQIDRPLSSKVLALLGVYGKSPEVRRLATEILRQRKPEDFLELLVELMIDPLRYEVRPVGGPGSPGVLFVEGEKFNMARYYTPPLPPNVTPRPGDIISYDPDGSPSIIRRMGAFASGSLAGSKKYGLQTDYALRFSEAQMVQEAQRGAMQAQTQLEGDVEWVESVNQSRKAFNDLVMAVAKYSTGKDRGPLPKDWRKDIAASDRYVKKPAKNLQKPTLSEDVPLDYRPAFAQITFLTRIVIVDS